MKETVNIKINQLPSKTWHWLKLNETNFAWTDEAQGCTIVKKESTENEALSGGKERAEALADIKAFEAVETGAGRQADCVFKAVAPERITAAAGRERTNPVVYEISGTDSASARYVRHLCRGKQPDYGCGAFYKKESGRKKSGIPYTHDCSKKQ